MRIASLVPAGTEIAHALGLTDQLVAVTHDCDFPPVVRSLPRLTSSTIPEGASSRAIDDLVRSAGDRGESTFHVDGSALRAARPDVILGQTICRVCAVTLDQLPADLDATPCTIPLTGATLDGVLADIQRVADGLGIRDRGLAVTQHLHERLEAIRARVGERPRPRVACLEWLDPLFPGGHWVPEQVEIAGGIDVLWPAGRPSAAISWDEVVASRPEILVLMPCGWDTRRALREAEAVTARPGFDALPAARSGRVYATNGSAYFSRPGPRLVDGVEILAALFHPDLFPRSVDAERVPLSAPSAE